MPCYYCNDTIDAAFYGYGYLPGDWGGEIICPGCMERMGEQMHIMNDQKFIVGDQTHWTSGAGGYQRTKEGPVIAIIPPGVSVLNICRDMDISRRKCKFDGIPRDHESYIIQVGKNFYQPRVSMLVRGPKEDKKTKIIEEKEIHAIDDIDDLIYCERLHIRQSKKNCLKFQKSSDEVYLVCRQCGDIDVKAKPVRKIDRLGVCRECGAPCTKSAGRCSACYQESFRKRRQKSIESRK